MVIEVTADDIDAGIQGDCMYCPLALAIYRKSGRSVEVWSDLFTVVRTNTDHFLPDLAKEFRRQFDAGRPVSPIAFEVDDACFA